MSEQDTTATWLLPHLRRAATRFGVWLRGEPVPGWRGRSLWSRATGPDGDRWVRVVSEHVEWIGQPFWTGNHEASVITNVPKPQVLDTDEYREDIVGFRAELMTYTPGPPFHDAGTARPTAIVRAVVAGSARRGQYRRGHRDHPSLDVPRGLHPQVACSGEMR